MQTIKALYRDAVLILIIILLALGIGQVALKAILTGEWFKDLFGILMFSLLLAMPITIYRLLAGIRAPFCDDVLGGLTIILLSAIMVYTGFVILGSILTL